MEENNLPTGGVMLSSKTFSMACEYCDGTIEFVASIDVYANPRDHHELFYFFVDKPAIVVHDCANGISEDDIRNEG